MTTLDYPGQPPRVTDDAEIIATLTRKGWIVRPDPPAYDPQTHTVRWDGAQWVVSELPPPAVPESIPAHKLYAALEDFGVMAKVDVYINTADARTGLYFRKTPSFARNAIGVENGRVALGWTHEQVDDLFRYADALQS